MDGGGREPGRKALEAIDRVLAPFVTDGVLNPRLLTWAVLEELGPIEPAIAAAIEAANSPQSGGYRGSDRQGNKKRNMGRELYLDRAQLMLLAIIRMCQEKARALATAEAVVRRDQARRRKVRKLMEMRWGKEWPTQ